MKYSDLLSEWLKELGYTHCFYVSGGNIMHLLDSVTRRFTSISTIHEAAAGIAAEYFNETNENAKAFALVTAGPGLTNIVTAMAGAYLESRELLVIGGQVKTADLSRGSLRQRGIQEIDGVAIARPVTVRSVLLDRIVSRQEFAQLALASRTPRMGPVFIEIPLDIQGRTVDAGQLSAPGDVLEPASPAQVGSAEIARLASQIRQAERPMILIGGGISRAAAREVRTAFAEQSVPLTTTWNGADRVPADHPCYFGRPNTWGQRYANLLLQQSDLLVALGTRLGLQQTGFNWQQFVPAGKVVQVECDAAEIAKGHPRVDWAIQGDANEVLRALARVDLGDHAQWLQYCRKTKRALPLVEPVNQTGPEYISPYEFVVQLSQLCRPDDVVIPCSSGGAFTVMMQAFNQKSGQVIVTNKGLAAMGYGLSGAMGAAFANPNRRTILVEGDGGFTQNLQEIGTAALWKLNLKIFVFDDNGYASIRMTQRSYFNGRYVGCDRATGLGLPNWDRLFAAWDVPMLRTGNGFHSNERFLELFNLQGIAAFVVTLDPNQTYFPKITSRVTASGSMESNPLHRMSPDLPADVTAEVSKFLRSDN